jgi:NAD(P)-dependent dehydrogenase (short-subunit alcohol dehydrogenase family)
MVWSAVWAIALCLPALLLLTADLVPFLRGVGPFAARLGDGRRFAAAMIPESTRGRVVVVTGANTGLGFSSAKLLALAGAHVVMGCRSASKCAAAAAKIREAKIRGSGGASVAVDTLVALDLASLASVKAFAAAFLAQYSKLDALLLNAGIMSPPFGLSEDAIEMQFAVNHLGHFYLTQLLLPRALETAKAGVPVHIASVSSMMSFVAAVRPTRFLSGDMSLSALNDPKDYGGIKHYAQSKLANVLFAKELHRRVQYQGNVIVTAINPGFVATELTTANFATNLFTRGLRAIIFFFAWSVEEAALTQVYAVSSPELTVSEHGGSFIFPIARHGTSLPHIAQNMTLAKSLWEFSEELIRSKTKTNHQ